MPEIKKHVVNTVQQAHGSLKPAAQVAARQIRIGPILAQITTAAVIGAIVLHADNAQGILKWFSGLFADVARLAD